MKASSLPPPVSLKVVAFDCDGVLLDSRDANVRFYSHVLQRFGRGPIRPEQVEYIHMHSSRDSLRYLLGDGPASEEAWDYCQEIDFHRFFPYSRLQPGLKPFLESIKPLYGIALATNRTVSTREVLSYFELDRYFDVVVSAADVLHPKPHPHSMEKIFEAFGAKPEEILYIGDSRVDEDLARNTGVFFAAYRNESLEAHLHVEHFSQLHPFLVPGLRATPTSGDEEGLDLGTRGQ